jgi:hypothetical protein
VDELILGAGQSSLQNADAALWSAFSVQVADITTTPPGSGPGGNLLSDTEHLIGSSYYIAPQLVERWTTSITVPPAVSMVTGVTTTLSQASVYGWDCSLNAQLTVSLAMDLSTPE